MLKSIVNGAEHDIISIPMKGKNLFDGNMESGTILSSNGMPDNNGNRIRSDKFIEVEAGTYTLTASASSSLEVFVFVYDLNDVFIERIPTTWISVPYTFTLSNKSKIKFIFAFAPANNNIPITVDNVSNIMLNIGSTALPYEPYGYQNGWEVRDNQNRLIWGREDELQTTTGNLLFKGYDLPVKVNSLLGNGKQAGGTTTISQKSVTVAGIESGMDYAMFLKSDFPNVALGDEVNIIVSGTTHSLVVKKIDTQYVYIENEVI